MEVLQPEWATRLSCVLECYNVNVEEDDEDPRNINIPEMEGCCEIRGPSIEDLDITVSLKTKQVNIGMEVEPEFAKIGDYWDAATVDKVTEFIREYQDLFPTKFMDLKGIIGHLGVMKITLKFDAKPVKKRPYHLNPKYKEKVCLELDKMLTESIIEPV